MWNYVTYRDAIRVLGVDPEGLYPGGVTRLPDDWADLGWLTCFAGPPASAVEAMREAVTPAALNQYTPDLLTPLRDAAARVLGRPRDDGFEVIGTDGAQAGIALSLMASIDPGDEVIVPDPGYFHVPSAVLAAGGRPVFVRAAPETSFTLDPEAVAAAIPANAGDLPGRPTTRTARPAADALAAPPRWPTATALLSPTSPTDLPRARRRPARPPRLDLTDGRVATVSVSRLGHGGARVGFPPARPPSCAEPPLKPP